MACRALRPAAPFGSAEAARLAERDARLAARLAANRRVAAARNAPRADEPLSVAECGALIWTPPNQPPAPLEAFEQYAFAHCGRTLSVLYNRTTGDVGLVRPCRGAHDADTFSQLIGGRYAMLATLAVRDGLDRARVTIHRAELFTEPAPVRAFAAVIRRKYPDLSFHDIVTISEWMGPVSMTFRLFVESNLHSEALRVADRQLMAEAERAHAAARRKASLFPLVAAHAEADRAARAAAEGEPSRPPEGEPSRPAEGEPSRPAPFAKPAAAPALARERDDLATAAVVDAVAAAVRRALAASTG